MPGSPLPWLKHVRSTIMSKTSISTLLGKAPVSGEKALYVMHLSAVPEAQYPAITLHFTYNPDRVHHNVMRGQLQVDVWVPDRPKLGIKGGAVGKTGLWQLYSPIRSIMHKGHLQSPRFWSSATHEVSWLIETSADDTDYEAKSHLYHLAAMYDVVLAEVDWCPPVAA